MKAERRKIMKRKLMTLLLGATFAVASGMAAAHSNVSFGVYLGAPAYSYSPAPVYYAPPPVYYAAPAYPYYYGPAYYGRAYWGPRFHDGRHRGWDHRHWR
jgi:hypothetical protein